MTERVRVAAETVCKPAANNIRRLREPFVEKPDLSAVFAELLQPPEFKPVRRPSANVKGAPCVPSQKRRRREYFFQKLIERLSECGVLFLDPQDRVVYSNPAGARILGYDVGEIEGVSFPSLLRAAPGGEQWKSIADQDSAVICDWLERRDGKFYGLIEALALRDESGVLQGRCVFLRDEDEKRKIRDELKEKGPMAAIGTATAMLAHEIRNPLNGMSTTVQFLERSLQKNSNPSKEMIVGTVQDLKNEIGRLQTLLDDFHALSHPQQVQCGLVDVQELVCGLIALLLPEPLQEKVTIIERFDADVAAVPGDADKLKQVFLNLIKNSFEAMPRGGTLTARSYTRGATVCVEIADTGIGIAPDLNVFDLFRSTKPDGTGLGLAIARQIVEAHGGAIEYSSAPGVGTTFRVILPAPVGLS